MNNKRNHDLIKSILIKQGYNAHDIDSRVLAVISYCDKNKIDALELLDQGFQSDQITKEMVDIINSNRPNTSFVTKRNTQQIPNKFIRREIIG